VYAPPEQVTVLIIILLSFCFSNLHAERPRFLADNVDQSVRDDDQTVAYDSRELKLHEKHIIWDIRCVAQLEEVSQNTSFSNSASRFSSRQGFELVGNRICSSFRGAYQVQVACAAQNVRGKKRVRGRYLVEMGDIEGEGNPKLRRK
jgi:hypothetical protein